MSKHENKGNENEDIDDLIGKLFYSHNQKWNNIPDLKKSLKQHVNKEVEKIYRRIKFMYGKIFDSMYKGSLCGHWEAIVTFQQMIVLCDSDGVIDMTPQAISATTTIPLEIIQKGIEILQAPDPYSRTPNDEGRRIKLLEEHRSWGWQIINHSKYRDLTDYETVKAQNRERQKRYKDRHKPLKNKDNVTTPQYNVSSRDNNTNSRDCNAIQIQIQDTNTNTDTKDLKDLSIFVTFWTYYPARNGKKLEKSETQRRFNKLKPEDQKLCIIAAKNYSESKMVKDGFGIKDPKRFILDGKGNEPWRDWIEPEKTGGNGNGKSGTTTSASGTPEKAGSNQAKPGKYANVGKKLPG